MFLRFLLRPEHVDRLHKAKRLAVRGQPGNGFIIAPDTKGNKLATAGSSFYLQYALSGFDISQRPRKRIDVQPEYENGHIRIPPLPAAWVNADPEFVNEGTYTETDRHMKLPKNGRDDAVRVDSKAAVIPQGATSPVPKATPPSYVVPNDASMSAIQTELATKLGECRALIRAMEDRTKLKLMLDRNLRVVVALPS
jgi:hypothetical protein